MGLVSSLFAHKVVTVATANVDEPDELRRELFESVGVDPDAPVDPKFMIPDTDYYALCERVTRADPHSVSVPLRVGSLMLCDDYGAFGLAWKTAPNLRASFARAERYALVLTNVSTYEFISENGKHYMALNRDGERRLGLRLSNEQTIVAVTQISREVSTDGFTPEAVYFKHPSPGDLSAHEEYFGCPVRYDADRDALQVSEEVLARPNRLGDTNVAAFIDTHLEEELKAFAGEKDLAAEVREAVTNALSSGVPTISDIAGPLGMSGRTLQRRLAEDGHTFQSLVDTSRRELSERLLNNTDYSLAEVAFMTGFSEQSAFTRAFKRWAGQTPRSFRIAAR
jgi:AraC-like DNA-binding protein